MTTTSGEGKGICCQEFVSKALDISVTARDLDSGEEKRVEGYTAWKYGEEIVFFIWLMCGSCRAMISHLRAIGPLRRECWAIKEELRFCCHTRNLVDGSSWCSDIIGGIGPWVGGA